MTTPLDELARRFAGWGAPGDAVVVRTLDTLGALVTGAGTAEGGAIGRFAGWDDGVLGDVVRRVAMTRMTELDDIHMRTCTTPGAVVVPTAVTVGAALNAGPAAYARAVEIGYEAMIRLGGAIGGALAVYRGVWPTYFCAPFAAAAVVASLLELGPEATRNALGIALTRATGLTSGITGTPLARWLTLGDAARAGCSAAFAARDGFIADADLERVAASAGVGFDRAAALDECDPAIGAVSVKPFPTAKQSLAATEAALRLRALVAVDEISLVRVHVPDAYAHMVANPPSAASRLSRMSSARWNVALALTRPNELHDVERAVPLDDPEPARVAALVEVVADPEMARLYPNRWPARVVIGDVEEVVVNASGDPPANGREAVEAKWRERRQPLDAFSASSPYELDDALRAR
ncbi:MAG TPA: MmgE/PrpD family protein [Solirubrobacteraceae bacterium]|nr:MmgE/PrpD family protein [Solirubrobacteraceae bacterium]